MLPEATPETSATPFRVASVALPLSVSVKFTVPEVGVVFPGKFAARTVAFTASGCVAGLKEMFEIGASVVVVDATIVGVSEPVTVPIEPPPVTDAAF